MLLDLNDGGDVFKRLFVLYACGMFLAPTAGHTVDMRLVSQLERVSSIRNVDWCGFVVDTLCEAVVKYKICTGNHIHGCLVVLVLAYLHRFPLRGCVDPMALPLIRHWSMKKLSERIEEEKGLGFGKSIMVDLYLVSKQRLKPAVLNYDGTVPCIRYPIPDGVRTDVEIQSSSSDVSYSIFSPFNSFSFIV